MGEYELWGDFGWWFCKFQIRSFSNLLQKQESMFRYRRVTNQRWHHWILSPEKMYGKTGKNNQTFYFSGQKWFYFSSRSIFGLIFQYMGCTNDTWQFEFWRQEAQKIYVLFLKNAKFLTFPVLKIDKKIKISKIIKKSQATFM